MLVNSGNTENNRNSERILAGILFVYLRYLCDNVYHVKEQKKIFITLMLLLKHLHIIFLHEIFRKKSQTIYLYCFNQCQKYIYVKYSHCGHIHFKALL